MPRKVVDAIIVMEFIRRLSTPFTETSAFKAGLIDKNGKIQKRRREMTKSEKRKLTHFDILVFNLKKLLAKLPGGDSKIRNFATALFLLKEEAEKGMVSSSDIQHLAEEIGTYDPINLDTLEENIAVSIGAGAMDNTVHTSPQPKTSKFGKCQVYHVSGETFSKCRKAKGRYERFMKYVGEGPVHDSIKDYAKKNPGKSIMLHDETLGTYTVLKLGSKESW